MSKSPLSGIKVIEMAAWHTGPMAATILGDLGADVIKVEPPRGDDYRIGGTTRGGFSASFMAANRNKRSIALDLKVPEQKAALDVIIASADILIHNQRPGVMERLGFGADDLRRRFPRLIYASISGYGQTGPKATERAFDPMIQAQSGVAALNKDATGRPRVIPTLMVDKLTSPLVAQAICAALFERERTGKGGIIDLSMLDAMVWWNWADMMTNHTFIGDGVQNGADIADADFVSPTLDGHIILSPHLDSAWANFVKLVERPELADDPRFATAAARVRNLREFSASVRECLKGETTADWCRLLAEADIPCAAVNSLSDVANDPQVRWNDILEEVDHPIAGRYRSPKSPVFYDGERNGTWRNVPAVGEHTAEILHQHNIALEGEELGLSN